MRHSLKKIAFLFSVLFCLAFQIQAQDSPIKVKYEFKQMTAIESVVPGGLGRSRLLTTDKNGKSEIIKLDNFFSLVGINFDNIQSNDQIITQRIEALSNDGWELMATNAGAYGSEGSTGIFITRYIFRRPKM